MPAVLPLVPFRMRGQDCFLAQTEVLQDVLLPRLSAVDLMRLGATLQRGALLDPQHATFALAGEQAWPRPAQKSVSHILLHSGQSTGSLGASHTCYCWQKAPRDVAAAHLASLPSTKLVLLALQKACAARQRIQANCSPVREVEVRLYDQRAGPHLQPGYKWYSMQIDWALLSPCGSYIAVGLSSMQDPVDCD